MMDAPTSVQDPMASRPANAMLANLFSFTLVSGPVYRFTDWRRPIVAAGNTYLPKPRMQRGTLRVERGMNVSTLKITVQEANADYIRLLALSYFNRALFSMDRVFAPRPSNPTLPIAWTSPFNRFTGRLDSVDTITRTSAELTIKSMLDDLDNDFPRGVVTPDCDAVVFDARCGLNAASYRVSSAAAAGTTKNLLLSNLTQADDYFTQGVFTFTSGELSGLSWMVKSYKDGKLVPAQPFFLVPAAGDAFTITPGCDKTWETCISKYGYHPTVPAAPYFRGLRFVPDPTVTY